MWDVKENADEVEYFYCVSFILTMWDVKFLAKCECCNRVKGFILTMWDVKCRTLASFNYYNRVLY